MAMMRLRREDPRVVGSFKLHRRLGSGGMGVVYLGSDRRGQRVALKVIRPELAEDQEFRSRFAREVSAASRIRGGCTARLVAADLEAERPWLATQYVPGPSLYDKVGAEGPLPAAEVAAIGSALAEGLLAVHEAGVVHRDLKPSNILLSPKGPRIIDFGIAWATGASTLTHVGTAVGSPGFLAPEQVRGVPVTPATDVFALGATLAYAASADSPFGQGSSEVMLYRVVHEEPCLSGVPEALAPLIQSCLAKDPDDRPSTAQLHERLREIHLREVRGLDHPVRGYTLQERPVPDGRAPERRTLERHGPERHGPDRHAPDRHASDRHTADRTSPDRLPANRRSAEHRHTDRLPSDRTTAGRAERPVPPRAERGHGQTPPRPVGGPRQAGGGKAAPGTPSTRPTLVTGQGAGQGAPSGPSRRTPVPGRPGRRNRGLLRQRIIIFFTVTVLVALGIAAAQGCQGGGNEAAGAKPPSNARAHSADGKRAEGHGNVAPPGPSGGAPTADTLALTRGSANDGTPSVDWQNRGYADEDGGARIQLRDGRWHAGDDTVRLTRLIDAELDGRPAQVVVLTRTAGPVRQHLLKLYTFDGRDAVLVASHVAAARPRHTPQWRVAGGALVREQFPTDAGGSARAVVTTTFTPLEDGTFAERHTSRGA